MASNRRSRAHARPRAVLYGRQSETTEESISLELQKAANREHAAREGYEVVAVLEDEDISGRRWSNRPGVAEAVRLVEAREADVIVVWKWSRFSRNRLDLALGFDRVETAGGRVESSTEGVDTKTASGRFARGMLGEVAAFESERIGEGWKETHASRRARGVPASGGDRYGYRRVRDELGHVTGYEVDEGDPAGEHGPPRPSPAEALRLAYRWVIDGWGANRIVGELNRRGYRNLIGEPFKRHGIYPLLDSGFAAGLIVHRERDATGRPTGEPVYLPGNQPPIIDEPTWTAYLATRRARAGQPPRALHPAHPLSGLMRCGACGASMTAFSTPGPDRTGTPSTYACTRWRGSVGQPVRPRYVGTTRPRAERLVREWLAEIASDVEAAAAADRKVRRRHARARTDAVKAREDATRIEAELGRLAVMRARNEIAAAGYDQARSQLEADLERAQAAADEAELAAVTQPAGTRPLAGRLLEAWDLLPTEDLNAGLRRLLRGVWVFPPPGRGHPSPVRIVPRWEPEPEIATAPPPEAPAQRDPPADEADAAT